MAEKVIFEFRGSNGEGGFEFGIMHGMDGCMVDPPPGLACYQSMFFHGMRRSRGSRRANHFRDKTRRRIGETLDFFERMYDDLYGEGSGKNED